MSTFRSVFRHSAAYSVPVVLGKMGSFFLLPVYTRYLTPSDYGVLELLDLTAFVLTTLLGARLGDALCYFYSQAETPEDRDAVASTAILLAAILGAFGTIAGFLFTAPLGMLVFGTTLYSPYFHLVFANFALALPQEVGLAYLRVQNQTGLFTVCLSVRLFVAIFFNVLFLAVWSMGISGMLWGTLVASAVMAITVGAIMFSRATLAFRPALCRSMIGYTIPIGVSGTAMLIIHYGDRFFLQRAASLADVGVYSLAYKLGMLISYVQLPFMTYWTSQMYRIVRGEGGEAINARVCTYLTLALSMAAVAITVFSRPVLGLLTTQAFRPAYQFIPFIAAAYVIRGLGDQFRNVFFMENRTIKDAQSAILGSILCLAAYMTLIPRFKIWGAVTATGISFTGVAAYSYWKAQRVKKYHYEVMRLFKIGFSACAACAVSMVWAPEGIGIQVLAGMACLFLFVALLAGLGFFTPEEIETVHELRADLRVRATRMVGAL